MKFDYIIGNPPYQEEKEGTSDSPIYNYFMDDAYGIGEKVELITPARFLFNAGKTPKNWNEKMLRDEHLKVLCYEQDSSKFFSNTDIKGGVVITYRDQKKSFGAIEVFTSYTELNEIRNKVVLREDFRSLSDWVYAPESYKFTDSLHSDYPDIRYKEGAEGENLGRLSKGHDYDVVTNVFSKLPDVFLEERNDDQEEYYGFVGLIGNKRYTRWIKQKYIRTHENLKRFKVILPKSNGSGAIGEVLSTPLIGEPLIGEPLIGHTQSFISIGCLDTFDEAEALYKYIKTKFARTMLGILKITQDNKKNTWKYVPLQDFSSNSDINWSESITDIDRQLYAKYGLDENEIEFIETHVKEMN
ncbi:MAG: Eco57I restriction-modification methylase domain-containing protein [Lachnospiraceae bacterium]|nr:Eco57I restriction-modification methylase domain-containing protein [Lachnospiraceae bacterium]